MGRNARDARQDREERGIARRRSRDVQLGDEAADVAALVAEKMSNEATIGNPYAGEEIIDPTMSRFKCVPPRQPIRRRTLLDAALSASSSSLCVYFCGA